MNERGEALSPSYFGAELDFISERENGAMEHQPAILLYRRRGGRVTVQKAEIVNEGRFLRTEHHGLFSRGGAIYEIRTSKDLKRVKREFSEAIKKFLDLRRSRR